MMERNSFLFKDGETELKMRGRPKYAVFSQYCAMLLLLGKVVTVNALPDLLIEVVICSHLLLLLNLDRTVENHLLMVFDVLDLFQKRKQTGVKYDAVLL